MLERWKKNMRSRVPSSIAFLPSSKKTVLLILILALASIAIIATISILLSKIDNLKVPSLGTIKAIGVEAYWDPNCENKTETVDWGTIWLGSSQKVTFYVRSISNVKTTLRLNATNWNPANLSDYMNLSWDYNGTTVHPLEAIQVTLTLSAPYSSDFILYLITTEVNDFSFDIIITTSE
jgi:hypothetical protein